MRTSKTTVRTLGFILRERGPHWRVFIGRVQQRGLPFLKDPRDRWERKKGQHWKVIRRQKPGQKVEVAWPGPPLVRKMGGSECFVGRCHRICYWTQLSVNPLTWQR